MAEISIKNGNSGDIAKVDTNLRLFTASIEEEESNHACNSGIEQKYNINTGDITLTDAVKTAVLYIENTGNDDLVITALIYNLGNTTSGTGDIKLEVLRSNAAMTGDIVTNTNDCEVGPGVSANQNFGSTNTLTGKFYKGATSEGAISGGTVTISTRSAANTGRILISLGKVTLPKGSSLAVDYTPPASNSSQICQFAAAGYVRTSTVAAG
jgi:hypothetical protein